MLIDLAMLPATASEYLRVLDANLGPRVLCGEIIHNQENQCVIPFDLYVTFLMVQDQVFDHQQIHNQVEQVEPPMDHLQ